MKKIINGRKYDTETAKKLGEWWNGRGCNDFSYIEESLYKKKTGEYFLDGEGGAMTKYSRQVGDNTWGGSEKILPLTEDEAREWVEEKMDADEYEAIFGEVAE